MWLLINKHIDQFRIKTYIRKVIQKPWLYT